jgi:hypothetical protein
MNLAELALQIEQAFDGVAVPGAGHPTLYQAEAKDSYAPEFDRSLDHLGRWQDLPFEHLRECPWAIAHLDSAGLHYYTPAILVRELQWRQSDDDALCLPVFESLRWALSPRGGYELREHRRAELALFTPTQRLAILAFYSATDSHPTAREAWARAVAHDESGSPGDWFDAFWPERDKPAVADVLARWLAAFPTAVEASNWTPERSQSEQDEPLASATPQAYRERLPTCVLYVLQHLDTPIGLKLLQNVARSLHPRWGDPCQGEIRERLAFLTQEQRGAVAEFADLTIDREGPRIMWRRAAAHAGAEWFEVLKVP